MHVGVLSTSYPRSPHDWAGHFVRGHVRWLRREGHAVTVVCAGSGPRRTRTDEDGIVVHRIPGRGLFYGGGAPEALSRRRAWLDVPPFVAELGVRAATWLRHADALITHWLLPGGLLGCLVANGRRHLAVAHSGDVHLLERLGGGSGRALAGMLARRASLAFVSAPLRERFLACVHPSVRQQAAARSAVISMGIDIADYAPRFPRPSVAGRLEVAFIGRRVPIKGLEVLERAVAELPGIGLRVADGAVTGDDKRRFLEKADVLAVPSLELPDGRTEGTPTVLFEGMASGLPVVASRTGGIPDAVRDGSTGLLVRPGDAEDLARALVRLRDDLELRGRLARGASEEAVRHDWSRVGPTLATLL